MRELPAAESHHSYAGGLLEHTVGVATLARETSQLHPRLRADLLLAAALLHDVGRVRELSRGPSFRRDRGRAPARPRPPRVAVDRGARRRPRSGRARRAPARGCVAPRSQRRSDRRSGRPLPREPARRRRGDQTRRGLVLAIALALGASLSWGLGDFFGGLTSRTMHVLTVLVVSQVFGLAAALTWVAASGDSFPGWSATALAAAAGACGCLGIATLYRGMAIGAMGIVAPDLCGLGRDSVRGRHRLRRATERAPDRRHPARARGRRRRVASSRGSRAVAARRDSAWHSPPHSVSASTSSSPTGLPTRASRTQSPRLAGRRCCLRSWPHSSSALPCALVGERSPCSRWWDSAMSGRTCCSRSRQRRATSASSPCSRRSTRS